MQLKIYSVVNTRACCSLSAAPAVARGARGASLDAVAAVARHRARGVGLIAVAAVARDIPVRVDLFAAAVGVRRPIAAARWANRISLVAVAVQADGRPRAALCAAAMRRGADRARETALEVHHAAGLPQARVRRNERCAAFEAALRAAQVAVARFGLTRFREGRVVVALIDRHRVGGAHVTAFARDDSTNCDTYSHNGHEQKHPTDHTDHNGVPRQPRTALHVASETDLGDRVATNDGGVVDVTARGGRIRCKRDIRYINVHLRARRTPLRRG